MAIPSYETLLPMVLKYAVQERRVRDAVKDISDQLGLTDEERAETIPSGSTTLISSRLQWAVTYLVQAGLMMRPKRGHFIVTEAGMDVIKRDLENLNLAYLKTLPEFTDFINRKGGEGATKPQNLSTAEATGERSPEEIIGSAYQELEGDLKEQILERILQNSPAFFEALVVKLLSSLGYGRPDTLAEVMGKVGDGGIDGIRGCPG